MSQNSPAAETNFLDQSDTTALTGPARLGDAGASVGFFDQLESPAQLLSLLNNLPATYFFSKDLAGRFVHVNPALAEVLGFADPAEVIGRTDYDLFPPEIASQYREQDQVVIDSGHAQNNHVCAVPNAAGVLRWYVETKIPLVDSSGKTIGIAGVMYDLEKAGAMLEPYERLNAAITHITNHFADKITLEVLAELSHLSVSQFKRVFKQHFRVTPSQYLFRVRINASCLLLRESSASVESIADQTGFYDASHFVKQFRTAMGKTPREFREQSRQAIAESGVNP
ncbi:helix-turn-helix domain-containing protein [Aeoliella sp. SH292]|uniref:PAS domain-containing protein n=1 Tax=Aeoliella sp. SH292 TaxID=3454464 RepID=UPI003F9B7D82